MNFNEIPDNLKVPGAYLEIDSTLAGFDNSTRGVLIIGQKNTDGEAVDNELVMVTSVNQLEKLFGKSSELYTLINNFKKVNSTEVVYALPLSGVNSFATASIELEVDKPQNGLLKLKVGDTSVDIVIENSDTTVILGKKIVEKINSLSEPLSAEFLVDSESIKLTATISGENGNNIPLVIMQEVSGVTLVLSSFKSGVSNPSIVKALSLIDSNNISYVINPYCDEQNVRLLKDKCNDMYKAMSTRSIRAFMLKNTEMNELISFANNVNSPHCCLFDGFSVDNNTSAYSLGYLAGAIIRKLSEDPSAPIGNYNVMGLYGKNNRSFEERNLLLNNGIVTLALLPDASVVVNRSVSTYHTNAQGDVDGAYLDIQVAETLSRMREVRQIQIEKEFAGYKLFLNEKDYVRTGVKVVTPGSFKAWLISYYQTELVAKRAWCQDVDSYVNTLIVQANKDKTRLDFEEQPTLTGAFYVSAGITKFH